MNAMTGLPRRGVVVACATLTLAWCAFAWIIADRQFVARADALVAVQGQVADIRARDLAGSIGRNLHFIRGVPDVVARTHEVKAAFAHLAGGGTRAAAPRGEQSARMAADPGLRSLSRFLATAQESLDLDVLFVADAAGDVIAASDFERKGPSIGTSVSNRDYFGAARSGRNGMQYGIGKATGIPGLFFSAPVMDQGRFLGAVVAKVHMPHLSFLLDQSDAFLTDVNGVVIMAHDRALEMYVLPGAPIEALPESERMSRYHRTAFRALPITSWSYGGERTLVALAGGRVPGVMTVNALPEYGIEAHVFSEIAAIPALRDDRLWIALLLSLSGGLVIVLVEALVLYVNSVVRSRERLWEQAHFDGLTGLANRALFRTHLVQAAEKASRSGTPMALLIGDIDGFKRVNDTLGHSAGDQILEHAARRISGCVRNSDTVARLGGDEFAVILAEVGEAARAASIAQDIVVRLASPFHLQDEHVVQLSASFGIALFPDDAADIKLLVTRADQAMYVAKRQGGNRYARLAAGEAEPVPPSGMQAAVEQGADVVGAAPHPFRS